MAGPYLPPITDIFYPPFWNGLVSDFKVPADYIGDQLLPRRDIRSDKILWDILKTENPMSPLVAIGTNSPLIGPEQYTQAYASALYTRWKVILDEHDLRAVRDIGDAPLGTAQGDMAATARRKLARQAERLSHGVDARIEWLQINALLGSISVIAQDNQSEVLVSQAYAVQTASYGTAWSDTANADPLSDFNTWFSALNDNNIYWTPKRMVISRQGINYLLRNTKLRQTLYLNTGQVPTIGSAIVQQASVQRFFQQELGVELIQYDAMTTLSSYNGTALTNTYTRILPASKVIILPAEDVGFTGELPALLNNYQPGKFTWMEDPTAPGAPKDPPNYQLGCGWYGLPVVTDPNRVLVATIY